MKTFKYFSILFLLLACGKELDIKPTIQLDADVAKTKIDLMLVGAYSLIGSGGIALSDEGGLYATDLLLNGDLLASEGYMSWRGTFNTYNEICNKAMSSTNTIIIRMWRKAYQTVNLTNNILELLPNSNIADKDLVRGQALFIRGAVQFELLRFWKDPSSDLGIPLMTVPTNAYEDITFPSRANIADSYAAVISDLETAKSLLPDDNDVFADRYTATAFLARVYLDQGDYAAARDEADEIITAGKYKLPSSVEASFNTDFSTENIFEIIQTTQNNAGVTNDGLTTFYACDPGTPGSTGRGDVQIDSAFITQYEPQDKRRNLLIYAGTCFKASVTSAKWKNPYTAIPVIRLSEIYLVRAECNNRLGVLPDTVLKDVNRIRIKAGASQYGSVTLNDILQERALELAFEGQRIHDFKRLGVTFDTVDDNGDPITVSYSDPEFAMPIPQQDINANKNLEQNSYYQ